MTIDAQRDVYTHGHHESVLRSHLWRTAENSAAYLLPHLAPGMALLDVGCGPGTITLDLARRVAPGRVVGIDRSAEVVERARAQAVTGGAAAATAETTATVATSTVPEAASGMKAGVRADVCVELAVGDVYALGFPDASFDVVHAHQVLQHLTDPVAALREMRRVACPGGVVAVRDSDYASFVWAPLDPLLARWLEVYRAVARRNRAVARRGPLPQGLGAPGRIR